MAVTPRVLINAKLAENVETSQYVSTGLRTIIDKFTVTNTTGGAVSITVKLIPNGGSAGASNTVLSAKSIAAGDTYTCPEVVGQVLESGDIISTLASAATSLTIRASGRQVS